MTRRARAGWLSMGILMAGLPAGNAGAPEFSVIGSYASGTYGTGVTTDTEALGLHAVVGDRFRLRGCLPALRVREPLGVAFTAAGPAPLSPEQRKQRQREGEAAGASGREGGGGRSAAVEPSTVDPAVGGETGWVSGLGDLRLAASTTLTGGGSRLFGLDAAVEVKVPTADEDRGLGTGEWDARLGLSAERRLWSLSVFGGAGWNRTGDPAWAVLEDPWDGYVGIETEPLGGGFRWSAWLEGSGELIDGSGSRALLGVGLRTSGAVRWHMSAAAGLTSAAEDFSVGLSLGWGARRAGRTVPPEVRP